MHTKFWTSFVLILRYFYFTTLATGSTFGECSYNGVCLPVSYNKHEIPQRPTHVEVVIDILQVTEVNDELSTINILMYLMFWWKDKRLVLRNDTKHWESKSGYFYGSGWRHLDAEWFHKLWFPDIFVYEIKGVDFQKYLVPYQGKTIPIQIFSGH